MISHFNQCIVFALLMLLTLALSAATDNIARPVHSTIVPDQFLRTWDAVTLFFDDNLGPKHGGPEDEPQRYVTLTPSHPGAYTWLDARTLQFRPADPWPPLTRFIWQLKHNKESTQSIKLDTLMAAPDLTIPAEGAEDLDPVNTIMLRFSEPVNTKALTDIISIELRPLPGIDASQARWLDKHNFSLKILERRSRGDNASYVLNLHEPIQNGTWVKVHLRLAMTDPTDPVDLDAAFYALNFKTKTPLRITHAGCVGQQVPLPPSGVSYTADQALRCNNKARQIEVLFSTPLATVNPVIARHLIHLTPAVDDLHFDTQQNKLLASGQFKTDIIYRLQLEPTLIKDRLGNALQLQKTSQLYFYFPKPTPFLSWQTSHGIIEQFGPQMLPLQGRGFEKVDIRLYPINPLERSLWPFPSHPIEIDEAQRPPSPGETATPYQQLSHISAQQLREQISTLGSPSVSKILILPTLKSSTVATFGLNLTPLLQSIQRDEKPGTYLIGLRQLNHTTTRSWMRVQVTDLSLTTVEEFGGLSFLVSSLRTGLAIPGATLTVEGYRHQQWQTITTGTTNHDGHFIWQTTNNDDQYQLQRFVVQFRDDKLVIDPLKSPEYYHDNYWADDQDYWITQPRVYQQVANSERRCHIFTERPVYRPDHTVHIKGYVRDIQFGEIRLTHDQGILVVTGPDQLQWRYPLTISKQGSFYHAFAEKDVPTGSFSAVVEFKHQNCGSVTFKKEAYRVPTFEVKLHGPQQVRLDQSFKIKLTANYYAGGKMAQRPIRWRVTQFPYTWSPQPVTGFYYATDGRYAGETPFRSQPVIAKLGKTDNTGNATINIDPTLEPTAQPRRYVIEATLTGADDQTVTDTLEVTALPPFVLAVKMPRYLETAKVIKPEVLVANAKGDLLAGQKVNVRLLQRQWHSHLQANDFSQGVPKYITEVIDETIAEQSFISEVNIKTLTFPIKIAGVYIVEVSAQDQLGRSQQVIVDMFASNDKAPVTWSRAPSKVFKATPDKSSYQPGEQATIVLESPFQQAQALAIVEQPNGRNTYQWLTVDKGHASFQLTIKKHDLPRLPVHFVLMRGRLAHQPKTNLDLGKPTTLAATTWITIEPIQHQVNLALDYPHKAQPGDDIEIDLALTDVTGKALAGEVTLWLVDQAVLALGQEQRLNPLPDMLVDRGSQVNIRDTRNSVIGYIPFQEHPGGGSGAKKRSQALLDKVTVRRNFNPVPYYRPDIIVDASGQQRIRLKLPDNLTNFKLRAKVISGPDRFGFNTGQIAVRLPVIVQPGLPRFVRPGDQFTAVAIARVVEGDGGPGQASLRLQGLENKDSDNTGELTTQLQWHPNIAQRIEYPLRVPNLTYTAHGQLDRNQVTITLGVARHADGARDAFRVNLPIKADRRPIITQQFIQLDNQNPATLSAIAANYRPGSLRRRLLFSQQSGIIKMAAGLNYLLEYPHGCTEQRISQARAFISTKKFRHALFQQNGTDLDRIVSNALTWLEQVITPDHLLGYWPGSPGFVSLTAWGVQFMLEAQQAGISINEPLLQNLLTSLQQALRSDYDNFIDGEAYNERVWALSALAAAGQLDQGYLAELARRTDFLSLESTAIVARLLSASFTNQSTPTPSIITALDQKIWQSIVIRLHQNKAIYGGLQTSHHLGNQLILPSETRTIAQVLRASTQMGITSKTRQQLLVDALITIGADNGWGSTQANTAAMLALTDTLGQSTSPYQLTISSGPQQLIQHWRAEGMVLQKYWLEPDALQISTHSQTSLHLQVETRYLPATDGSHTVARAEGFVIQRTMIQWVEQMGEYQPMQRFALTQATNQLKFTIGDIIEEHIEVVNPEARNFVAIVVPLAAGLEPLNPNLATAAPEAQPEGQTSMAPTYVTLMDDQLTYYYNHLPKGHYHFYFRTRATVSGVFIQPAAYAQMMYQEAVQGNTVGAKIMISPKAL